MPRPPSSPSGACRLASGLGLLILALGGLGRGPAHAAPPTPVVVGVVGTASDGDTLASAGAGASVAAARSTASGLPARVEVVDDGGTPAGLQKALKGLKAAKAVGVVAVPRGDLGEAWWKAARSLRVPIFFVSTVGPDLEQNRGNVWHLAPSPVFEGVFAADAMVAPLAARRVGVVHESTAHGAALASAFSRNLSARIVLAGVERWPAPDEEAEGTGARIADALKAMEADWIYVAMRGGYADKLAAALEAKGEVRRCVFADGNVRADLLGRAPTTLEGSVFVGGPDPELEGRVGEDLVAALEDAGRPHSDTAIRAFEATRLILAARKQADGSAFRKVRAALEGEGLGSGALGPLRFEPHHAVRFFPLLLWRIRKGRLDTLTDGPLPTMGCGPPLAFGRAATAVVNERRGKVGYLTYGEGETRTIEKDLIELGLSTGGKEPELDAFVREEILARAIRIAHHLFRREPDGTPIPGWSWGMSFTTADPSENDDLPRSRTWLAIVAGDHPAAGGQVIGSGMVAVYSTFLKRTMYIQHKLDPPISGDDRVLLDGTYRWGEDRTLNRRADEIRCLIDGLSSAVGLTLSHEFGHLCGCGHDTEHPTSIMNVVAGAGAAWADAVWIPSHQRSVTTTLGIEGVEK